MFFWTFKIATNGNPYVRITNGSYRNINRVSGYTTATAISAEFKKLNKKQKALLIATHFYFVFNFIYFFLTKNEQNFKYSIYIFT